MDEAGRKQRAVEFRSACTRFQPAQDLHRAGFNIAERSAGATSTAPGAGWLCQCNGEPLGRRFASAVRKPPVGGHTEVLGSKSVTPARNRRIIQAAY